MIAPAPIAAVDVGTNSIHMVIARQLDGGTPEILGREKESVRLGRGSNDMKRLEPDAIGRAVETLDRFRRIARAHGAEIVAVATSAVREAENQAEFLQRARDEAAALNASNAANNRQQDEAASSAAAPAAPTAAAPATEVAAVTAVTSSWRRARRSSTTGRCSSAARSPLR